jgi:predicted permease
VEHFFAILEKILFIILLIGTGVFAKKMKWVSDEGEKDLSRLSVDFVWPAMIFSSIVTTLSAEDILSNLLLPVLTAFIHLTGFAVGLATCRLAGYCGSEKKMLLFHATMNNFLAMSFPFALFFFPEKGAALLAVANLGSIVILWTVGVIIIAGNRGFAATARNIFSPGMLSIVAGAACVLSGAGRFIPDFIMDVLSTLGGPTLFLGLFVAGTQIYKLGPCALKFNGWNILVGFLRTILIPAILFGCGLLLRGHVSRESLIIFMIVSITPANVNSVTLALKFGGAANLAAEGVLFTHIFGAGTMIGFIMLIEKFFL